MGFGRMGEGSSVIGSLGVGEVRSVLGCFLSTPSSTCSSHKLANAEDPELLSFLSFKVGRSVHDLARLE